MLYRIKFTAPRHREIGILALTLGFACLHAVLASADGTIYTIVTLTNNTAQTISIPSSGAHTPQAWGTGGNTLDLASQYVVKPDGSPPNILGPGQTMLFGAKSNGEFLANAGAGGSLDIPGAKATVTWSTPWANFKGSLAPSCSSKISATKGGNVFGPDITVSGGPISLGDNACLFAFVLNPTSGEASNRDKRSELTLGQSLAWPTSCPNTVHCLGADDVLTSPDGSTTLRILRHASGAAPSGGVLVVESDRGVSWSSPAQDCVVAVMQADGNFVAFDAAGKQVWASGTAGHPGAFLRVDPTQASVVSRPNTTWTSARAAAESRR